MPESIPTRKREGDLVPDVTFRLRRDGACSRITLLLPDGNGEFTRQMGMLVDKSDENLGQRSWRYSMLARDKKIEKLFAEPDKPGDPFEGTRCVSGAAPAPGRRRSAACVTHPISTTGTPPTTCASSWALTT